MGRNSHYSNELGDENDILIDDRPHRANCENFKGDVIKFDPLRPYEWLTTLGLVESMLAARDPLVV